MRFFRNNGLFPAFLLLFIASLTGLLYFGIIEYSKELEERGIYGSTFLHGHVIECILQNGQNEFLSVFVLVVFSIYLRQTGSPQSKPADASNNETGK